jgi:hypothetical protein
MIAVKGLRPKLQYPQLDLAGLGLQLAFVMSRSGIAASLSALVTLRIAQPIRLCLNPLIINRDDIPQADSV